MTLKTKLNIQKLKNFGFTHLACASSFSQMSRINGETSLSKENIDVVGTPPYRKCKLVILDSLSGTAGTLVDTSAVVCISLRTHHIYLVE